MSSAWLAGDTYDDCVMQLVLIVCHGLRAGILPLLYGSRVRQMELLDRVLVACLVCTPLLRPSARTVREWCADCLLRSSSYDS
jgi:hypothetical protein